MNIFKKDKSLELQGQIDDLMSNNSTLKEQCNEYQKTISSFPQLKMEYDNNMKQLKSQYEKEKIGYEKMITDLRLKYEKEIEIEKKSVAKRVNKELFTIGISETIPEEISPESNMSSPQSVFDKFMSMKAGSKEAMEFYGKYSKVIDDYRKSQKQ